VERRAWVSRHISRVQVRTCRKLPNGAILSASRTCAIASLEWQSGISKVPWIGDFLY
jgi:hypothetical protein